MTPGFRRIKISGKCMRQRFQPCTKEYILNVCGGRCCKHSSGGKALVHPKDRNKAVANGGTLTKEGFLVYGADGLCPFQTSDGLCRVHDKGKPAACNFSPFTINKKGLFIVKNRNRLLKCYGGDGAVPAYEAHRFSLNFIFGEQRAGKIAASAAAGADEIWSEVSEDIWERLQYEFVTRNAARVVPERKNRKSMQPSLQ